MQLKFIKNTSKNFNYFKAFKGTLNFSLKKLMKFNSSIFKTP